MNLEEIRKEERCLKKMREQAQKKSRILQEEASNMIEKGGEERMAAEDLQMAAKYYEDAADFIHRALRRLETEEEEVLGTFNWDDLFQD